MKKYLKNVEMEYIVLDDAETVIHDTVTGNIHYIDQISTIILQQLESPIGLNDLFAILLEMFDGNEKEIKNDTAEFIKEMVQKKIVLEVSCED